MKQEPRLRTRDDDVIHSVADETAVQSPSDFDDSDDGSDRDDSSEVDCYELIDVDEKHWDVFIDDEEDHPGPDYGDFWMPD